MTSEHDLRGSAGSPRSPGRTSEPSGGRAGAFLVLLGCGLVAISLVVPVMRWQESPAHDTAGSAMLFLGDGWTLADGGFPGWRLVPISIGALLLLAISTLAPWLDTKRRRVQLSCAIVAAYYPIWVLTVFVRKFEDQVYPAEGTAALLVGTGSIAAGLWRGRPR